MKRIAAVIAAAVVGLTLAGIGITQASASTPQVHIVHSATGGGCC